MTFREAEDYLLGLELFGMRFGLDRMHKLMTVLGMPQRRFASIHVVGSNGKSSTVRMIAAILERHGLRTGSYTSPHLRTFAERVEVGERPLPEPAFAAAVARAARAAELVNRTLRRGRRGHPVRGADRRRVPRAREQRRRGGRDRGRPRRPLRRHERDPVEGPGAHERRARAHALARADDRGHRAREARRGARPRDAGHRAAGARGATRSRSRWRRPVTRVTYEVTEPWRGPLGAARRLPALELRGRRGRRRGVPRRAGRPRPSGRRRRSGCRAGSSRSPTPRSPSSTEPTTPTAPGPWRRRSRASGSSASSRSSTTRTRPAMLETLLPLFERVVFTRSREPALAAAGDARVALYASSTGPPSEIVADPKRRSRGRASSPDRTAPSSPPGRST